MPQKDSFNPEHALLLFLLIFGVFVCGVASFLMVSAADGDAFFALRSCHQQLVGDSGEFFSPDYLCSNPSLWCNWTIRAAPGQRIHLQLEDFTPDDSCHLKQDQIHVDDPAAHSWGHRVLQKCWREAKYTSSSNALDVVLLIGAWPHSPYRGFYGRYQAFGPPVVYNPQEAFSVRDRNQVNPTSLPSTRGTSRPGRDVTHPPQILSHSAVHHESSKPNQTPPTAVRRDVEEASDETRSEQEEPDVGSGKALDGEDWIETSDQHPSSPEGLEAHPHPNMVELLSEHRGSREYAQGLISIRRTRTILLSLSEIRRRAVSSPSPGPGLLCLSDVNECGTQLVLCDVNADCVNQFGSYSCHCRPGFLDRSRLGSGGTVCVDVKAAGCSSGLSGETKGVYVLFFLLSSLVLMLLAAAGTLYHRHRRGMFLVRCHSNSSMVPPPDRNNNHHQHRHNGYSVTPDSDLPPPPPPSRGPRESWPPAKERSPAVDLPLLRFSALLPPDGYMEPREGGKMCTD
uniref:EGF-like domain-containing protein n=1 Tax=Echeneis naucrates TaxID=173247 RepID=A0A665U8F8_ECHNA